MNLLFILHPEEIQESVVLRII